MPTLTLIWTTLACGLDLFRSLWGPAGVIDKLNRHPVHAVLTVPGTVTPPATHTGEFCVLNPCPIRQEAGRLCFGFLWNLGVFGPLIVGLALLGGWQLLSSGVT